MKAIRNFTILCLAIFTISSCQKADKATEANVSFTFDNFVDEKAIEENTPLNYLNAAGNYYSVSLLKYYISNIILVDTKGKEIELNNNDLIDAFGNNKTDSYTIPNGEYRQMRFIFGVNADNNTSGDQSGDLDPSNGMLWSWATGYIFFKHEGKYLDAGNTEKPLEFHYGGVGNQVEIELNNLGLKVDGEDKEAYVSFNLNNMYSNPKVDFNDGDFRHSGANDGDWVDAIKANMSNVFTFNGSF
jgi:hypothetical protein